MKAKDKNAVFICQITESCIKVAKFFLSNKLRKECAGCESENLASGIEDAKISASLSRILQKLGYRNHPIIVSLPRSFVTCRYLKVPSEAPEEIARIVSLQAAKYLPYSQEELITGFEVISTDKEGYSQVNLIIAQKEQIQRQLKIFAQVSSCVPAIAVSSLGLACLYSLLKGKKTAPEAAAAIDFDAQHAEVAIFFQNKLLFSRSFKLNRSPAGWEKNFLEELNKTQDAYLKETSGRQPEKIFIFTAGKNSENSAEILKNQINTPIETLPYGGQLNLSADLENSFANLLGLSLIKIPASLNLLPENLKNKVKQAASRKKNLRSILLLAAAVIMSASAILKNFDHKLEYLAYLRTELNKVSKQAQPLEAFEKRLKFAENRLKNKPSSLDILHELYQIIPAEISLSNFTYDRDGQVILNGKGKLLNSVFKLVSQLEKSPVFKAFKIKVKYATQRKTASTETVDFEIACSKE